MMKKTEIFNNHSYKRYTNYQDPYWDEGRKFHKLRNKHRRKRRYLTPFMVRMYKTWKYNRKNQYKD